ncbi:uncharacterized protein LOC130051685 [Ostrea edulis]|uniref:uncharacterized protein LOC130051685 n=1 Tax=Ostrea edulis TaxID=37623 RepID=UPI0024AFA951|nr:uncharacterized protein LOC130051685 [Ostrea edulis]
MMPLLHLMSILIVGITKGVSMNSPSLNTLTSYRVDEGQTISLKCSVFVTASELITWYWTCGDDDLTRNSTSNGKITTLTFKADRKFNGKYCYCTAKSTSLNQTNEVKSRFQSIQVYYAPLSSPTLNASQVVLTSKSDTTLLCSIESLGNPPIRWSWKCGTQTIRRRITSIGLTSNIILTADPNLDGKSCYCTAESSSSRYRFEASSNAAAVTILYFPSGFPRISRSSAIVKVGLPVTLQCSLPSAGNPQVTWSWHCNGALITENVRNMGRTTEISFISKRTGEKVCHCRAKSSISRSIVSFISREDFERNSSNSYIRITDTDIVNYSEESKNIGISPAAFGATLTILLVVIVTCTALVVIQHRRIPKESSLLSWFLVKIGRQPSTKSESDAGVVTEEHSYEVLQSGNQKKNDEER